MSTDLPFRAADTLAVARQLSSAFYVTLIEEAVLRPDQSDTAAFVGDRAIDALFERTARALGYRLEKIEANPAQPIAA